MPRHIFTDFSCLVQLANAHVEQTVRDRIQRHGGVYSGVDMEELFPGCWTPLDEELGELSEGT